METREPNAETSPEGVSPRGPWGFLAPAARMGLDGWTLQFMAAWLCFHVLSSTLWALHLKALAGSSAMPAYWGELLTLRDLWELAENGGLKNHPFGLLAPLGAGAAFLWSLWAGWKLQARAAGVRAGFGAWCGGFLDALLVGALPIGLLGWMVLGLLEKMASSGIQGLGWLDLVGGTVARFAFVSTFFLQAWLCRLGRAGRPGIPYSAHLGRSFLRLWTHPVQWPVLVVAGSALRAGLPFLVLVLGWRLGGGTPARVAWLLLLQALAVAASAWLMAWFLRVTALYWRNDAQVRDAIQDLEARVRS